MRLNHYRRTNEKGNEVIQLSYCLFGCVSFKSTYELDGMLTRPFQMINLLQNLNQGKTFDSLSLPQKYTECNGKEKSLLFPGKTLQMEFNFDMVWLTIDPVYPFYLIGCG